MTSSAFELSVSEVTAMEARVIVRYVSATTTQDRIFLRGTLRGPYCETARTLPAEFPFHNNPSANPPTAAAVVSDPCLWSRELPHVYRADVEALCDTQVIAEYHGEIGLRSTTPIRVHE